MEEVLRRTSLTSHIFVLCLLDLETDGAFDFQGRAGIMSILQWNLRLVIFGVEKSDKK